MHRRYGKVVQWWLLAGVIMVFVQIVLGGITRLTGSGLSITKWEIVTGTLPPLNAGQWDEAFGLYKETPQYQKINEGMSMSEFKVIYFWEYLHRLWARSIGLVFIIPFVVFLFRRKLDRPMLRYLGKLVILGLVVAAFGWIMVASGLNDRPWVNAYKLTIHLNLGILLYAMVFWVFLYSRDPVPKVVSHNRLQRHLRVFTVVLIVQLLIGGIMSGMKAGLYYPTWPDMNGVFMPDVLLQPELWRVESFVQYDTLPLAPALVQFMHRMFAYAVLVLGLWYVLRIRRRINTEAYRNVGMLLLLLLILQVTLGIITVINCVGELPIVWGVLHQAGAIGIVTVVVYLLYYTRRESASFS